jgi:hypothetical protein
MDEDDSRCPFGECGSLLRGCDRVGEICIGRETIIESLNSGIYTMKKYYLTNRYKFLFGSLWLGPLIIIIPMCILSYSLFTKTTWMLMTILFIGGEIVSAMIRVYSEYLTLSENGIIFNTAHNKTKAAWSDVEKTSSSLWWFFKTDGLFVIKSEFNSKSLSFSSLFDKSWLNRRRFIPLGIFSDNWRDSELGQQIKQYAPHLFK